MAKWQPRVTPEVEAELRSLGPYDVPQGGYLLWDPAPGFEWPWGRVSLGFGVHPRNATDADYRRLIDAWRQVCARRAEVLEPIRDAVLEKWDWAAENLPPELFSGDPDASDDEVLGQVRGGHFALSTSGPGQVAVTAHLSVAWDEEHGVEVDLIDPERRGAWSFL